MEQLLCPNCYEASPVDAALCVKCTATTLLQGRYRLRKRLGTGGTSQVFLADDLTEKQPRAIKVLQVQGTKDWKGIEHFERQLSILQSLNHPGIPKVFSHFEQDFIGRLSLFSVQEWIEGDNLDERIKKGLRLQEKDAVRLLEQLLEIVAYLHAFSPPVLHRDIKPRNIILKQDGCPAIIDFDTARGVAIDKERADGTMVGTAGFVPMEQLAGQAAPASDLYALGMTMIALLSHKDILEIPVERMRIKFEGYVNVSKHLSSILQRMVEPAIEDRYQSTSEVLADVLRPVEERRPERHKPSYIPHKKTEERRPQAAPQSRAKNSSPTLSAVIKPSRKQESSFLDLQQQIETIQEEARVNPQEPPTPAVRVVEATGDKPYRQSSFLELESRIKKQKNPSHQGRPRMVASSSGRGWLWLVAAALVVLAYLVFGGSAKEPTAAGSSEKVAEKKVSSLERAPAAVGESMATMEPVLNPTFPVEMIWAMETAASTSYQVFDPRNAAGPPTKFGQEPNYDHWQPSNLRDGPAWLDVSFVATSDVSSIWVVALSGGDMLARVDDLEVDPPQVIWKGDPAGKEKNQALVIKLDSPRRLSHLRFVFDTERRIEWVRIDAIGLLPAR